MKRPIYGIIIVCALIIPVMAISYNFQNSGDVTYFNTTSYAPNPYTWTESTTGGNNVMHTEVYGAIYDVLLLKASSQTTYAAATVTNGNGYSGVRLYNSAGEVLYSYTDSTFGAGGRYQMIMSGSKAYIYRDGILRDTSGTLAVNPSFVGFGTAGYGGATAIVDVDNYVYGSPSYVLGLPESSQDQFIILTDITNPASDGLYNTTSGTQVNANYMSGTWARGNTTTPLTNDAIQLI